MKRFIRYLYEYHQGQRIRNVGFVKVEQDENSTVVHIHGKGLHLTGDKTLKIYIFYVKGGECIGVWQGDIEHVNPAVNYRLAFTDEDTGRPENYPLVEGVILENGPERKFAAVWDDMPAAVEQMQVWKEEPKPILQEVEEQVVKETEECEAPAMPEEKKEPPWQAPTPRYQKIQRKDIAQLRRCEWKLANNSFLLHGCYNYHHLLLIEEGDSCWLGIPGIYHPREAQAAEAFGFPRFVRVGDDVVEWGPDEKNEEEDFGYWCRQVRR